MEIKKYWTNWNPFVKITLTLMILSVVASIVLAFTTNIAFVILGVEFAVVFGIATFFIVLYNNLEDKMIENNNNSVTNLTQHMSNSINHLVDAAKSKDFIYTVSKETLYKKMTHYVNQSEKKIDVMYLNPEPPIEKIEGKNEYRLNERHGKHKYHNALQEKINNTTFPIQRIILYNAKNKKWIEEYVIEPNKTNPNFSLYLIEDENDAGISVQIFDGLESKVVLMDLERHRLEAESNPEKNDVIIVSEQINKIFGFYYQRMIEHRTTTIIKNGVYYKKEYDALVKRVKEKNNPISIKYKSSRH